MRETVILAAACFLLPLSFILLRRKAIAAYSWHDVSGEAGVSLRRSNRGGMSESYNEKAATNEKEYPNIVQIAVGSEL
jgi:hypothetical protein